MPLRIVVSIVSCVKSSVLYWHIISAHELYEIMCVLYESYCTV